MTVAFSLTRSVTWGLNSGQGKMRGPKAPGVKGQEKRKREASEKNGKETQKQANRGRNEKQLRR